MLVTLAYFFHITTFYFIMKWVPNIVADFGFPASSAAGVLVWANVGGAARRARLCGVHAEVCGAGAHYRVHAHRDGHGVALRDHAARSDEAVDGVRRRGFFINGAIVGMYALFAQAFPTHVRAFGSGFAIGFGRGGSFVAPIIAGYLFQAGYGLPVVAVIMGLGSTMAAIVLLRLKVSSAP